MRWIPKWVLIFVSEVGDFVSLEIVVKKLSHHLKSILKLVWIPWVVVSILIVVNLDDDLGRCASDVFRPGRNFTVHSRVETDITLQLSGDLVRLVNLRQQISELSLKRRELLLSLLERNSLFPDSFLAVSFGFLSCQLVLL